MSGERLIAGIGNPEKKYERTRHNIGFLVVEKLAGLYGLKFRKSSFTDAGMAHSSKESLDLMLPLTYVNRTGQAVKSVVEHNGYELSDILVVCDDLNLPFGQLRIRAKGSDGGHNGLKSIIGELESTEFARLRIGIGQPGKKAYGTEYVLGEFSPSEKKDLEGIVTDAAGCCRLWLEKGIHDAMNKYNQKR